MIPRGGRRASVAPLPTRDTMAATLLKRLAVLVLAFAASLAHALDAAIVNDLAFGDGDTRVAAVDRLAATGDPRAAVLLQALSDGNVQTAGKQVLIMKGESAEDALTGARVDPVPAARDDVVVNNRVRRHIDSALAALRLVSPDRNARAAAANALVDGADPTMRPLVQHALERESDARIQSTLELVAANLDLHSSDKAARLAAVKRLGHSSHPNSKTLLLGLLAPGAEPDADVRAAAQASLRRVQTRLAWADFAGLLFSGLSLGSILLLAALGLAITYGLMGVINMAHGELIMIGAYTTYVVQAFFRTHWPGAFDWYLALAVPTAFAVSGLVGMALERSVIRWLYGRPLETLLATWGISLVLIQGVRTLFGPENVQVENPTFMSGGIEILAGLVLPWSRIVIIGFAGVVLAAVGLLLSRTRLGLFVRGVTQNRAMAACMGIRTLRVDTWAFGLGSGLAGLAGCALSQIGNVGPELGQSYIVDSFMVVVLGGAGQLAGTIYAALGLGIADKLLESWSGAVLAKIAVLVFIVVFIQKRPQGLFALKGRAVEA